MSKSGLSDSLSKVEKDDANARQKVNIYANRLHAIKRYMDKRNLPGIPQEFLELFFTASNNTEALMDELEGDKINIESTNRLLDILTNDMNELEEATYRIVQNATLTEQLLQYSNRTVHLMIMCKQLLMNPFIFSKENMTMQLPLRSSQMLWRW